MDVNQMIRLPEGVRLTSVLEHAFELSKLVEVGQTHYQPGPLLDGEADAMINATRDVGIAFQVGKMKGRHVNLVVFTDGRGGYYVRRQWSGHRVEDLAKLLTSVGVKDVSTLGLGL